MRTALCTDKSILYNIDAPSYFLKKFQRNDFGIYNRLEVAANVIFSRLIKFTSGDVAITTSGSPLKFKMNGDPTTDDFSES